MLPGFTELFLPVRAAPLYVEAPSLAHLMGEKMLKDLFDLLDSALEITSLGLFERVDRGAFEWMSS